MKKALLLSVLITIALPLKAISQFSLGDIDRNNDRAISEQELLDHRATLFDRFDIDRNGQLSEVEHKAMTADRKAHREAAMEKAGKTGFFKKRTTAKLSHRMGDGRAEAGADRDGDGQISKAEFLSAAQNWFAKSDHNGDGKLDRSDRKK